jgi:hypothetical protein
MGVHVTIGMDRNTPIFTECVLHDSAYIIGPIRSQVFMAIDIQFVVFWIVKMEAIYSSETSVDFHV